MNPTSTYPKLLDNKFYFIIDPMSDCHTDIRLLNGDCCINMQEPLTGSIQPWRGKRLLINKVEAPSIKTRVFYEADLIELEKCFIIKNIKPQEVKTYPGGCSHDSGFECYPRLHYLVTEGLQTTNIYKAPKKEHFLTNDGYLMYDIHEELQEIINLCKNKYNVDPLKEAEGVTDKKIIEFSPEKLVDVSLHFLCGNIFSLGFSFRTEALRIIRHEATLPSGEKIFFHSFSDHFYRTFRVETKDGRIITDEEFEALKLELPGIADGQKYRRDRLMVAFVEVNNKRYKLYCKVSKYDDTDDYVSWSEVLKWEEI